MIGGTEIMRELEFSQDYIRRRFRSDPVPHAAVRLRDGVDHDLEAARADRHARAVGISQGQPPPDPPQRDKETSSLVREGRG